MTVGVSVAVAVVAAYLIGGIPWALVVGKSIYGIDPRQHESGNLGATNVFRVLGARAGLATLLLDALKGALAVLLSSWIVSSAGASASGIEWARVLAMLAAVAGHTFSPYVGFRGGKGVATSAGALFVLTPLAAAIVLVVFIVVVAVWRMVSLGSIVIAIVYPVITPVLYPGHTPIIVTVIVLGLLVLWNHRSNLARIIRGEERRISFGRQGPSDHGSED